MHNALSAHGTSQPNRPRDGTLQRASHARIGGSGARTRGDDVTPFWKRLPSTAVALCLAMLALPSGALGYSLTSPEWGDPVVLRLAGGPAIEGGFHGTLGSPSDAGPYSERYASWRSELGAAAAPALRDSLIVFRASGGLRRGRFGGFAGGALLLGTADSCALLFVPLKDIPAVRLADYAPADSIWTDVRERWGSAPSRYVLVLQQDFETVAVPEAEIAA